MENLKIKATTETASEIIDLLEANGNVLVVTKEQLIREVVGGFNILVDRGDGIFSTKGDYPVKEITLPQLRDMVVLKRNDVGDAQFEDNFGDKWYVDSSLGLWMFEGKGWRKAAKPLFGLKLIYKGLMKEYLDLNQNYKLVLCAEKDKEEGFIEVPEGADALIEYRSGSRQFNRNKHSEFYYPGKGWLKCQHNFEFYIHKTVWHRHTQPEELPFVDDEPSLNDQYAEIEKVRQSKIDETLAERQAQYGCFEDVAFVTESIMGILLKVRGNGLQDLPNAHRMALYMIASKMARIVNGDFNSIDGWHDISGYATLIERLIGGDNV